MHFTRADGSTIGIDRQLGQSSRNAVGGQHRVDGGLSRATCATRSRRASRVDGRQVEAGLGGMHVYVNGAIGGLMTTNPQTTVVDPYTQQSFTDAVARQGARAGAPAGAGGAGRGARRRGRGADRAANRVRRPHPRTEHRQHAVPARQRVGALRARASRGCNHIRSEVAVAHVRRRERDLRARRALSGDRQRRHRAPARRRLRSGPGGSSVAAGADARPGQVPGRASPTTKWATSSRNRSGTTRRRGSTGRRSGTTAKSTRSAPRPGRIIHAALKALGASLQRHWRTPARPCAAANRGAREASLRSLPPGADAGRAWPGIGRGARERAPKGRTTMIRRGLLGVLVAAAWAVPAIARITASAASICPSR